MGRHTGICYLVIATLTPLQTSLNASQEVQLIDGCWWKAELCSELVHSLQHSHVVTYSVPVRRGCKLCNVGPSLYSLNHRVG